MKKNLSNFFLAILLPASMQATEWIGISSDVPAPVKVNLVSGNEKEAILNMHLEGYSQFVARTPRGSEFKILLPGTTSLQQAGAPDVPKAAASLVIPDRAKMKVEVLSSSYIDFPGVGIAPSKGTIVRTVDPKSIPYEYGENYERDAFFPGSLAVLQEPFIVRDFRGQTVWFQPFQYNPVSKVLRVYTDISIKVSEDNLDGNNVLIRNKPLTAIDREYAQIYTSLFRNGANVISYLPVSEEGDMLIISAPGWMGAMSSFMEWKTRRGIHCELVDVSGIGNTDAAIKSYIQTYYSTHNLKYILLVGDVADVATPSLSGGASDPSYGYLSGNDAYAEVFVGRFSAQSLDDVETQVQRSIDYELNPDPAGTWYKKGVGIASDLGPGDDGEMDWEHLRKIRSDMLSYGFSDVDELYDGTHAIADATGDPWASDLISAINDGRSVINYTGHGSQNACATTGFSSGDVPSLSNFGMLPFWWSVGCVHGEFDNGTCIAEVLLRAQNGGQPTGMIAAYMSSINQYWDEPMDAQDEFDSLLTECYVNNVKRTFGGIGAGGCMHMNDNYTITGPDMTNTWHCFGDPSLMVRNNIPASITASHLIYVPVGTSQLTVNCNVNGALVTITKGMNILDTGIVQSNAVTLLFPALTVVDTFQVTATSFNGIPYTAQVFVFPASGPYVIVAANTVQDLSGNNNGLPDYGESIDMDVELKNVGLADATTITAVLSTTDPYITLNTTTALYGTITSGNSIQLSNAFSYTVAGNVPDQHVAAFDVTISDGSGNTWTSTLFQTILAPRLEILSVVVDDASGNNNGFLDPGETADIQITTFNAGHSNSPSITGILSSLNPHVMLNVFSSSMGAILPSGSFISTLNVSLAPNITLGTSFDLTFDANAGPYSAARTFLLSAGEILEDFETNNFSKFPWYFGGNANWITTNSIPFQGNYCARSGIIGNNASSELSLDVTVLSDDSVSFYKSVSSEPGYDFLRFYIDGVMRGEWSGTVAWSYTAYFVSTGVHTLKWVYEKDSWQASGNDECQLDNIQMPPIALPTGVHEISSSTGLSLYPNPVSDVAALTLALEHSSVITIKLFDMQGSLVQTISEGNIVVKQGTQTIYFSTAKVSKGIYVLQVAADGKVNTIRFVK